MSTISNLYEGFNGDLSLEPLIMVLRKMIEEGKPGAKHLYQGMLNEIEAIPELMQPIKDPAVIQKHEILVTTLLSTIFPPSTKRDEGIYAVCYPFRPETVYASPLFKKLFVRENNTITIPDPKTNINIAKANLSLAYNLILQKFYDLDVPITATSVHPFSDEDTHFTRYYELRMNAQFVYVQCINKDFAMPVAFAPHRAIDIEELQELFPLENFHFEGLVIMEVTDVTTEQVITEIKNALLNINAFSDVEVYNDL